MTKIMHFKCLSDLEAIIEKIQKETALRGRPTIAGSHPTLYEKREKGKYRTVMGVRICDYKFNVDETWVLPDRQMGLSFSATWENLRFVYGLQKKKAKQKKPVDIYWVLSEADIPSGMEFIEDSDNDGHYFLAVTKEEGMSIETLVTNLKFIAQRMAAIKEGGSYI